MALLTVNKLSMRFGGLKALSDFDFAIDGGELVGLIGPNGAGKTTAFNAVTGVYKPTAGTVVLGGRRIDGLSTVQINHAGIARTFQNIRLFGSLSVLDNVMVGFNPKATHGLLGLLVRSPRFSREVEAFRRQGMKLLETLKLAHVADRRAGSLPYGDQRRLEIARALATHPKVLCLDEPAAGMNPQEKIELSGLIRFIRDEFKVGIWLIEHDMKLVMGICERITVLDHGEVIAVGTPAEVCKSQKVIEAYLGEPDVVASGTGVMGG
jgi:branched-chain amino acid transport system ATP-binding protein